MSEQILSDEAFLYQMEIKERTLKDMNSALSNRYKKGREEAEAKSKVEKEELEAKAKVEKEELEAKIQVLEAKAQAEKEELELKTKLATAKNLLGVLDDESIAKSLDLEVSQVAKLRDES